MWPPKSSPETRTRGHRCFPLGPRCEGLAWDRCDPQSPRWLCEPRVMGPKSLQVTGHPEGPCPSRDPAPHARTRTVVGDLTRARSSLGLGGPIHRGRGATSWVFTETTRCVQISSCTSQHVSGRGFSPCGLICRENTAIQKHVQIEKAQERWNRLF